ncbi:MAG TPA: hypothetical protein VER12_13855 [Polyangiaceae bacterium]|nr:hypothetical protein [Polyangiaceae bacterium]
MPSISQVDGVGFAGELAALLLQNEANQDESAHLQRNAARERFLEDAESQVNELNAAANATMTTAFVSAAFTVVGGACEIGGAISQFKADTNSAGLKPTDYCPNSIALRQVVAEQEKTAKMLGAVGKASGALAQPTNVIGQSIAEHHQAAAKRSETAAAQSQWEATDANTAIDKASKQSDAILDTLQAIQRDQNASNNAIIGRI